MHRSAHRISRDIASESKHVIECKDLKMVMMWWAGRRAWPIVANLLEVIHCL